jgi:hypothetical protein
MNGPVIVWLDPHLLLISFTTEFFLDSLSFIKDFIIDAGISNTNTKIPMENIFNVAEFLI